MTGAAIIGGEERFAGSRIATDLIRHTLSGDATLALRAIHSFTGIERHALTFNTGFIGIALYTFTGIDHHALTIDA